MSAHEPASLASKEISPARSVTRDDLRNSTASLKLVSTKTEHKPLPDVISAMESVGPPPDGGLVAWMQVAVCFICSFNSWGIANSYGVYQAYYGTHGILEDASPAEISWIGAINGGCMLLGSVFFGFLIDAGYIKAMAYAGTILNCFALMMLSLSTKYYQVLLSQGVCSGLGCAILFIVALSAPGPYFTTKRAIALGIGAAGSAIGGTIYSIMIRKLLTRVGFAWSTRIMAFVELGMGLISGLLVRRRLPPRKRGGIFAWESFTDAPFLLYCLGFLFCFIGLYTFFFYYQTYALLKHPNNATLIYMTAMMNAGSVLGRIIPPYLADKVGPFNILVIACAMSAIVTFCWIAVESEGAMITVGMLLGFSSGAIQAMPGSVTAKLTPNLNRLGVRLTFTLSSGGIGFILSAPFAGMIIRKHGWLGAQLYASIAWVISTVFMVLSYHVQAKRLGKKIAKV